MLYAGCVYWPFHLAWWIGLLVGLIPVVGTLIGFAAPKKKAEAPESTPS